MHESSCWSVSWSIGIFFLNHHHLLLFLHLLLCCSRLRSQPLLWGHHTESAKILLTLLFILPVATFIVQPQIGLLRMFSSSCDPGTHRRRNSFGGAPPLFWPPAHQELLEAELEFLSRASVRCRPTHWREDDMAVFASCHEM